MFVAHGCFDGEIERERFRKVEKRKALNDSDTVQLKKKTQSGFFLISPYKLKIPGKKKNEEFLVYKTIIREARER